MGRSTATSYLGRTYSSTRTSTSALRWPAWALTFQTPRLGSSEMGTSRVAMPYSSVWTVFLKTLVPLASWRSTVASTETGLSAESREMSRTWRVWPGL